jgi:hypothetical protein
MKCRRYRHECHVTVNERLTDSARRSIRRERTCERLGVVRAPRISVVIARNQRNPLGGDT